MKKRNTPLCRTAAAVCLGILLSTLVSCTQDPTYGETTQPPNHNDTQAATSSPAHTEADTKTVTRPGDDTDRNEPSTPAPSSGLDPIFSIPGGMLEQAGELALTLPKGTPDGAYIVYTADGSEPRAQGKTYTTEIPVLRDTDCTVIRAAVFDKDGQQLGHTVTATYCKAGISTLRVVSLVTDPNDLYGANGILENRTETGKAGERPVSVEIFESDGTLLIRQDAAMRLAGAGSRSFDPANLRIIARKPDTFADGEGKYSGKGKFHARLFPDSACTAYDSFLLRCGGNDSLHQARDGFLRMNMLRDAIANNVCAQAETLLGGTVFAQLTAPVAVYLNGSYYGMLNMKQDFDENLIESLYALPEDGIALLKGKKDGKSMYYHIESGTDEDLSDWQRLLAYCAENACSSHYDRAYSEVAEQLDLANFSRYYAVMLYLCNTDWPQNNTMVWRYTPTDGDGTEGKPYADGKWRAVIRDMDLCFALHDKASQSSSTTYSMADTDTFYRITVFYRDGGYAYDPSLGLYDDTMGFQGLFDFLMRSEEFRGLFIKACEALCSEEFARICRAEVDRYYALALPEIPAHIRLWKAAGEIHPRYTVQHFKAAKEDMYSFIQDRPGYFMTYLEEALAYYR